MISLTEIVTSFFSNMKKFLLIIFLLISSQFIRSQELAQVSFANATNLSYFSFLTDGDLQIRVSADGNILEWGIEVQSFRNSDYYAPGLQPYMGRAEYYGADADSMFRNKVKSIGTVMITYYGSYETVDKIGKIKTIGTLVFDYFDLYADKTYKGKMKLAGRLPLVYYGSFEEEIMQGKLKSVSNTIITYHSLFDDKLVRGKIKSIGSVKYLWYTSLDIGRGGGLKTGAYRQNIGGVTYIIQ